MQTQGSHPKNPILHFIFGHIDPSSNLPLKHVSKRRCLLTEDDDLCDRTRREVKDEEPRFVLNWRHAEYTCANKTIKCKRYANESGSSGGDVDRRS
ncbi:hypothetical protein L596_023262 [Steinernema carpocapsae]|uniref:Uncharacterized protein n=1 Tax=Steinernema carpocapsae TaxID=34508 RepID=A0A4U5MDC2_STECR|nr:hypothetical protein L596_023262 [Steinernema carpocapsae]